MIQREDAASPGFLLVFGDCFLMGGGLFCVVGMKQGAG